jgi:hypothetical protein
METVGRDEESALAEQSVCLLPELFRASNFELFLPSMTWCTIWRYPGKWLQWSFSGYQPGRVVELWTNQWYSTLEKAPEEDIQTAQQERTLDPAQQSPLASGQQQTRSSDRYRDDGLDTQPRHLEAYLCRLEHWLRDRRISINVSKSTAMLFTRRIQRPRPVHFLGEPVAWIETARCLDSRRISTG